MLWWHILFCIISIHRIVYFVRSQDEEEESTTVPLSTTNADEDQPAARTLSTIPSRAVNNPIGNGSEQNINPVNVNESSKQRIIIALAVLCAALAVLLGFLVSIVVCQWWQHDKDEDGLGYETNKVRPDLVGSSYNCQEHAYRQTIKL